MKSTSKASVTRQNVKSWTQVKATSGWGHSPCWTRVLLNHLLALVYTGSPLPGNAQPELSWLPLNAGHHPISVSGMYAKEYYEVGVLCSKVNCLDNKNLSYGLLSGKESSKEQNGVGEGPGPPTVFTRCRYLRPATSGGVGVMTFGPLTLQSEPSLGGKVIGVCV